MVKKVHDKQPFYDRRIEPVVDLEWDKADFDLKIAVGLRACLSQLRAAAKGVK